MPSSLPFISPSRTVLMVSDEALYIYESTGSRTRLIDSIAWNAGDFEDTLSSLIRREGKNKPVLILNDMTDQHFKGGQRLPKVSTLDKQNVLTRKLAAAFPNYPIRGALPVKDKAKKAGASLGTSASGGLYLFAAVPMSEQVTKAMAGVRQSLASIAGFTLLPIESSDMLKAMADKASKKEKTKPRWAVLIGQHKSGGLRQVIIREGHLAMTRMTPVTDLEADPESWASEVAQEFKATISYLSRFGYSAEEGTEVFVITTPETGENLRTKIDVPCHYSNFTVTEAANLLGLNIGDQEDQYHADPLHVAWAGRKAKFILPMDATDIKKVSAPRQGAMAIGFLMFAAAGWLAYQAATQLQGMLEAREALKDQKARQVEVQKEYDAEVARMQALGFDIKLIQSSINTFKKFDDRSLDTLPLADAIGKSLGELRIDEITVSTKADDKPQIGPDGLEFLPPPEMEAVLNLSFPGTIEPEFGVRQVDDLSKRIGQSLPEGFKVEVSKQVADMSYTENTVGAVGQSANPDQPPEKYFAEITIRGPVK